MQSIEGTLAYVRYSGNLNSRLHQLQRFYKEVYAQYQIEQQKLQDLFGEFKVLETYNETLRQHTLAQKARRQQSFLDDLYGRNVELHTWYLALSARVLRPGPPADAPCTPRL